MEVIEAAKYSLSEDSCNQQYEKHVETSQDLQCPECGNTGYMASGCFMCPYCGYSPCG